MKYSVVVPVFNRPQELRELMESLAQQIDPPNFEVVVVEDGSSHKSDLVIQDFAFLDIKYHFKENSGPGDSRNIGMRCASGDYFLIFDSDCILPPHYLQIVDRYLRENPIDFFGGPDAALESFSKVQKAINFAMTSFLTTGGVRGGSEKLDKFQPRSFNMGISRAAFESSGGFADIHPGEDPDLAIRLWKSGFKSKLLSEAFVYHKRRIDWKKFSDQVGKFGKARPILDNWHPQFKKWSYAFPTCFIIGLCISAVMLLLGEIWPVILYAFYFAFIFGISALQHKSLQIGTLSMIAVWLQFFHYGVGYLESSVKIGLLDKDPREVFPNLFFKRG